MKIGFLLQQKMPNPVRSLASAVIAVLLASALGCTDGGQVDAGKGVAGTQDVRRDRDAAALKTAASSGKEDCSDGSGKEAGKNSGPSTSSPAGEGEVGDANAASEAAGSVAVAQGAVAGPAQDIPSERMALVDRDVGFGEEWLSLQVLGQKAGYMRSVSTKEVWNGEAVFVVRHETVLNATVGGNKIQRRSSGERVYRLGGKGELLSFKSSNSGDGGDTEMVGTCDEKGVHVRRTLKDRGVREEEPRDYPPTQENIDAALATYKVLDKGGSHEEIIFDTESRMEDVTRTIRLVSREKRVISGVETEVSLMEMREQDSRAGEEMVFLPNGRTLEIRMGNVLTAVSCSKEEAMKEGRVEVLSSSKIVVGGDSEGISRGTLRPPADVTYRVKGLPGKEFLYSIQGYQTFTEASTAGKASSTYDVRIRAVMPRAIGGAEGGPFDVKLPLADSVIQSQNLEKWMKPTLSVESTHPEVVALANAVAGDEENLFAASEKLTHFVYGFLEKEYGTSSDRASRVIETRKGDCTEHSLLFTAMARAKGIPTRMISGLVLTQFNGKPTMLWHQWSEIYTGNKEMPWVPVDPTFDEPLAGAGHIAFGESDQYDVATLFGALGIDIVSRRTGSDVFGK